MTLIKHELKQGKKTLLCWIALISFMLGICILVYPEISAQMDEVSSLFANMGGFSSAFGLDRISFGEFIGFFSIECGNVLGLGGAFFAAVLGISMLSKEESSHTSEFLLTHPISRKQIVDNKLIAMIIQILVFNLIVTACSFLCIGMIKEKPDMNLLCLIFFAYFLLQVEIACLCFGISSCIRKSGFGIGIGMAAFFYFLNLFANLTEQVKFLRIITPFAYADGTQIIKSGSLNNGYVIFGILVSIISILFSFFYYEKKDIL